MDEYTTLNGKGLCVRINWPYAQPYFRQWGMAGEDLMDTLAQGVYSREKTPALLALYETTEPRGEG